MSVNNQITVVFIGGFMMPENYIPYPTESIPSHIRVISVYPSSAASLHDRVMQIFYELKGGTVHYGEEHAAFHQHDESGATFPGKFPQWNEHNPVHLIGHSFGGLTARVLHAYLNDSDRFYGHSTTRDWVLSVNTMNAPLNGCLMVYSLGANINFAPLVRWGSPGFCIGILAHILGYIDSAYIKSNVFDFKLDHWRLGHSHEHALGTLCRALAGCCIHSSTDNAAYDMTLHSQLEWSEYLHSIPGTYYSSVVGTSYHNVTSYVTYFWYRIRPFLLRSVPRSVLGMDTSDWFAAGGDGLLSVRTQEFPFLSKIENFSLDSLPARPAPEVWHVRYVAADHLGSVELMWYHVLDTIQVFHESRGRRLQPKQLFASPSKRAQHSRSGPPDRQIPQWTLSARSVTQTSFIYRVVIATLCISLLASGDQQLPRNTLTVVPHILLSALSAMTSDGIEFFSVLARLVLLDLSQTASTEFKQHLFSLYMGFIIADALACILTPTAYEYCMPLVKVALASLLCLDADQALHWIPCLCAFDMLTICAKAGWIIRLKRLQGPSSWKWFLLWSVFTLLSLFLCGAVCSLWLHFYSLDSSGECLLCVFSLLSVVYWFTRIRDLSDAFQVELILFNKYYRHNCNN